MNARKFLLVFAALLLCLLLVCCAEKTEQAEINTVTVCLEQGRGFTAKSYIQTVEGNSDVSFQLSLQDHFEITGCSYDDYDVCEADNGYTVLNLRGVKYPERVTVTCEIPETVIIYDPNGGTFSASESAEPLHIAYGPSVHYRLNTLSGEEELLREGFVLTGWNTEPDGSGQHIGLGSRVTAEKNSELLLYAEWVQETDAELFSYQQTDDGILLTAYSGGSTELLVIPREISGEPVTAVGSDFAKNITIDALVIPDTVLTIEDGAFLNCVIGEIYFSDTLQHVSDAAFEGSRPATWHINAVMQPRYQAISDIASFADKMDLLILHENEKKLLLFSGCSMNYGLDSQLLQDAYPEYTALNLGAVGGTNTQFQFEIMLPYIHSGDVFIHAPEQGSSYQLMSSLACENRMFIAVEGNFDLLTAVDMTTLGEGAFECFCSFNEKRRLLEPCTYEDQYIPLNSFGDNISERVGSNTERFDEKYGLRTEYITEESLNVLCSYYDRIRENGAEVYLSYAPINALCCSENEIEEFSTAWEQGMSVRGYETVSDLSNYVMEAKYFYDTDYHLTTKGAVIRTEQLLRDLAVLNVDGQ